MIRVVVYVPADVECGSCRATKIALKRFGVPYVSVEADEQIVESLRRDGFSQFPVVEIDFGDGAMWSWSGFRRDDIEKLAQIVG